MNWNSLNIDVSAEGDQIKTLCPQCSHTRENKGDKCLSVNKTHGLYKCHHCAFAGSIHSGKTYLLPQDKEGVITKQAFSWFASRGISEETLRDFRVSCGDKGEILFKYYRNDRLVNIKHRSAGKKFSLEKDAELIYYNLDAIEETDEAIIVEGEVDAMSFHEAGFPNVVSVPNGANKNLSYHDSAYTYFQSKTRVYVAVDNDEKGRQLRDELCRRLKKQKCMLIDFPPGIKDANEYLQKFGKDAFGKLFTTARPVPVAGVVYLGEVEEQMMYEFHHGKERGTTTYMEVLNKHFNWKRGEVTIFSGIPGDGKSEFVGELCLVKSFKDGDKWGVYSPESYPANEFYDTLVHKFVGRNIDPHYKTQCTEAEYRRGLEFVREHFFYIYPEGPHTQTAINEKFEEMIIKHGITGGIIDPFNQLDHDYSQRDDIYLSEFLRREKRFAVEHGFYKIIVVHPKTLQKNDQGVYSCPTAYDLAGGAMWRNKADNLIMVYRPNAGVDYTDTVVEIHIQKIKKQQLVGVPGKASLNFDRQSRRYSQVNKVHPLTLQETQEEVF